MFNRAASILTLLLATAASLGQVPIVTGVDLLDPVTQGGTRFYINGENFDNGPITVFIGTTVVQNPELLGPTCIRGILPAGVGSHPVFVMNNAGIGPTSASVVYGSPVITDITPSVLPASGGMVTITGKNFSIPSHQTLIVNGQPIQPSITSHTQIQFIAPPGFAEIVPVKLIVAGQEADSQISYSEPRITSMTAASLPTAGGTTVTLEAKDFGTTPTVRVNQQMFPCTVLVPNAIVQFQLPVGLGTDQKIRIQNGPRASQPIYFDYDPPVITSLFPLEIPTNGQTTVTLSGLNFGTHSKVFVADFPAPTIAVTHNSITFIPPPINGSGAMVVVETGSQISNVDFLLALPPSISDVTPNSLPTPGGPITIFGENFGSNPIVLIDGIPAEVLNATPDHSQIHAIAPEGCDPNSSIVVINGRHASPRSRIDYPLCCPGDADGTRTVDFNDIVLSNFSSACAVIIE